MKITNNTTNIKQHKCLQKISEIVDKTQLKKKQFKYVININHEPDDKIKKDLEKKWSEKFDSVITFNSLSIKGQSPRSNSKKANADTFFDTMTKMKMPRTILILTFFKPKLEKVFFSI
ncbi:hypothetical protein ACTFIT_000016 [Dictyostelium discoideum]